MDKGYDLLAKEYYDSFHKTCRNFDAATLLAFSKNKPDIPSSGFVLEVGCGKGRSTEFLGIPHNRIIQLDSSREMLALTPREQCLLKVHADAASIPLFDPQFSLVTGFLIDPFIGLNFFSEAFRLLIPKGVFIATTPSSEWGNALREDNLSYAKFLSKETGHNVEVPSTLISQTKIREMLEYVGFINISITPTPLPEDIKDPNISQDIAKAAEKVKVPVYELPLIYLIRAQKP